MSGLAPYALLLLSPLCWASWLNFKLLCKGWRFESFYLNYAFGIVTVTLAYGSWVAGSPSAFLGRVFEHGYLAVLEGVGAGMIWGVGNILLVAAIILCGLAVGLKIAIGLSLVLGVTLTYWVNPEATQRPLLMAGGVLVVGVAIVANGTAYRIREQASEAGRSHFTRGVVVTVVCGILIGSFPLLQGLAIREGLGGVEIAFLLTVGDLIVALPLLSILARHPIIPGDRPVRLSENYRQGRPLWHAWAVAAGVVWSVGTIANLVVAVEHFGLSIAWAVGECSPLVGLLWGVFVFDEFKLADQVARAKAYRWLQITFALYVTGIGLLFGAT